MEENIVAYVSSITLSDKQLLINYLEDNAYIYEITNPILLRIKPEYIRLTIKMSRSGLTMFKLTGFEQDIIDTYTNERKWFLGMKVKKHVPKFK